MSCKLSQAQITTNKKEIANPEKDKPIVNPTIKIGSNFLINDKIESYPNTYPNPMSAIDIKVIFRL